MDHRSTMLSALVLACVWCAPAAALEYRIVEGTLSDEGAGAGVPLTGSLELRASDIVIREFPELVTFFIDDFALKTGDESFGPNAAIEFEGLTPILNVEPADSVQRSDADLALFFLRSGGEIEVLDADHVVYHFLDFRDEMGSVVGSVGDDEFPVRFSVEGTLTATDQSFAVVRICRLPTLDPPPPGGVGVETGSGISSGGDAGVTIIAFGEFDIEAVAPVTVSTEVSISREAPLVALPCPSLRMTSRDEYPAGRFHLVAALVQPIAIDVQPWSNKNRVNPMSNGVVPVAILGSGDFDVRDVDETSLRLGPGDAAPAGRRRARWSRRWNVNDDAHPDLVVFFRIANAGIALGDLEVCLSGTTVSGPAFEGCDAIQTLPRWGGARGRRR